MTQYRDLKRYERTDRQFALEITVGTHGFCFFTLWEWFPALGDGSEFDHADWSPIRTSGLYSTAQEAEQAATAEVEWLGLPDAIEDLIR
jgi:hypothetical protein